MNKYNNKFEYIASGCGFSRIFLNETLDDPESVKFNKAIFDKLNCTFETKFGILFNAFVESRFGPIIKQHYTDNVNSVHADSGGLQLITRGLSITPEIKSKIYQTQAKYSDIAMCFDEIPLSFSGAKSTRLDLSNRWFDKDKFEECAKLTGRNIHEQINTFLDEKVHTKPMFITQGNCYDTYMKWTELVMSQIPKDKHEFIGGVAMGAAALGHGDLEDIKRAFYFTQLPIDIEHKHLHLLAVGSVNRLLPNFIFANNGLYQDTHISYDSTTHTSGLHYGRYFHDGNIDFPKHEDKVIHRMMYDDIVSIFGYPLKYEDMLFALNHTNNSYSKLSGNPQSDVSKTVSCVTYASVYNFIKFAEDLMHSKSKILEFAGKKVNIYNTLYGIKSMSDFLHWEEQVSRYIKSKPVNDEKQSTLEDFF